jgi:hypothetical protein
MGMLLMWTILGSQRPNLIMFISLLAFDPLTKSTLLIFCAWLLAVEGITEPKSFKEFNNNGMVAIFTNLIKPLKVPTISVAACAAGTLREIQAYEVSAKSKMRLEGAMLIAQFYDNIGRPLDSDNILWPVVKWFLEQWKALMERKKANHGQPPKSTKNRAVHKWVDLFVLHLSQKVEVCNAPLDYIV